MDTLDISDSIQIPVSELQFSAVRSQGAGGQNVNKVASAIHLRFDIVNSAALPDAVKEKIMRLADRRITSNGVIVIKSQAYRTQERNRHAAMNRLQELIGQALRERKKRVKTKPGRASKRKRLDQKSRRGKLKRLRGRIADD